MKKIFLSLSSLLLIGVVIFLLINYFSSSPPPPVSRDIVQFTLNKSQLINVEASKLPEFSYDISDKNISPLSETDISIIHTANNNVSLKTDFKIDKTKSLLVVRPEDSVNFKPGLYRLSIKLRTLEGLVDIEQDFTWGVIAVNTNKSIYQSGELVKIGLGVLNDAGETLCLTGSDKVDAISMEITNPTGLVTHFSPTDHTIRDSQFCGPATVTNLADFLADYSATVPGIYQIRVIATVKGQSRQIQDYFKVEANPVPFDIERTSFPTRIYPPSLYPVTFTITPAFAYRGLVSDIVPQSFIIENISNGGQVQNYGEFKKVVWSVDLAKNTPQTFTYFIKFPMISPEFYLLGPISIGNFKEARQWQIASDAINSTSGVVTYEDNAASATWSRVWSGTTFGSQANMDTSPVDSRWFKEVSSPKTGEKLVAAFDNNNNGDRSIYMFRWNGSSWTQDFNINPATNWPDGNTRFFDVAYEELSGDALFIYSDTTTQLKYRKRVAGTWDASDNNAGTAMDSRKRWVQARSQFGSDSILVGYLNDNERVGALIWDGSTNSFGDQFDDDDSPVQSEAPSSEEEGFGVAWETQSGTPMIFIATTANTVVYREFISGSWSAESTAYSGFTNDVEWLSVAADPVSTSNYIALAFQQSDFDTTEETTPCGFGVWNGTGVETAGSNITCRSDYDGRINTVAFENNSSKAVWVYAISESGTTGNSIAWRTWTLADGYSSSTTEADNLSGNIESIQLNSDLLTTSMICLTQDSAGDLNYHSWDGTDWTTDTTDLHSNIQGAGENAEAFGFGFDRNLETLAAYKWFSSNNGTDVGAALTGQDAPYTLTTANQQFRLRILLYYPDSLLTAAGRQYKLQYVDPGTGTCAAPTGGTPATYTDVPSSGGTTISFYDNSTPADGDNLTANAADPTYLTYTVRNQDYEEANNFSNTVANMAGDEVGKWDFSLVDNTTYDRVGQTFCFRVARSNDLVLQIGKYPQITTAAIVDVLIQGGTLIRGGTTTNND